MKINSASESTQVVVGSMAEHTMTLAETSTLFYLLSESLYSNAPLAAYGEIVSNAWDSHITSGIEDTPISVTVDSHQNVTIQDFGSGIPHDQFYSLYGALGGSTKQNDYAVTGGMGIGKLAPLASVPSFMVTNCNDGIAKVYNIAKGTIDTGGRHSISLLSEYPSEETGLTVNFSNSLPSDEVIHYINNCNINCDFTSDSNKVELRKTELIDDCFFLTPTVYDRCGVRVLLGSKYYQVYKNNSEDGVLYGQVYNHASENGLVITLVVPEGMSLNFTPSREALIQTDHNKKIITDLLRRVSSFIDKNELTLIKNRGTDKGIRSFRKVLDYNRKSHPHNLGAFKIGKEEYFTKCIIGSLSFNQKVMAIRESYPNGVGQSLAKHFTPGWHGNDEWVTNTGKYRKLLPILSEVLTGKQPHVLRSHCISLLESPEVTLRIYSDDPVVGTSMRVSAKVDREALAAKLVKVIPYLKVIIPEKQVKKKPKLSKLLPKVKKIAKGPTKFNSLHILLSGKHNPTHKQWEYHLDHPYIRSIVKPLSLVDVKIQHKLLGSIFKSHGVEGDVENILKTTAVSQNSSEAAGLRRRTDSPTDVHIRGNALGIAVKRIYPHLFDDSKSVGYFADYLQFPIGANKTNILHLLMELGYIAKVKLTKEDLLVLTWLKNAQIYVPRGDYSYHVYCNFSGIRDALLPVNNTPAITSYIKYGKKA